MKAIPNNAERVGYSSIYRPVQKPSRFAPKVNVSEVNFRCPSCETDLGRIDHIEPVRCGCGLHLQLDGIDIAIWRDEPVGAA